jgi:N,N'-diacetylchitobiose transport system substrate-binding protein
VSGLKAGEIAPAFAGGNNIGVLKSTSHRTLAVDLMKQLASKKTQGEPFVQTLGAGTKFVPVSPAWAEIDASLVLPTMFQEIVSGKKNVATASKDAVTKMNAVFSSAG